jgi:hypothetical protein
MSADGWQTRRYKENRNPLRSHEKSAGFKVLFEGEDNITSSEGRDPTSVMEVQCS